jgi:hypothetical protein
MDFSAVTWLLLKLWKPDMQACKCQVTNGDNPECPFHGENWVKIHKSELELLRATRKLRRLTLAKAKESYIGDDAMSLARMEALVLQIEEAEHDLVEIETVKFVHES